MSADSPSPRAGPLGRHGTRLLAAMAALAVFGALAAGGGASALWFLLPYLAFWLGVRLFADVPRFQRIALNFALALCGFCTLVELAVFVAAGRAATQSAVLQAMYGLNITVGLMLVAAALIWKLLRYAAGDDGSADP
ncbi:hypothetical protein MBSD_n2106 [Mizugakiibacter sediminis]|uniref:Transmembrane protein n=2 Tax=Mizugakiibacter sediminis TaxID=1475481 RepID=A0A0K8QQ30_9GAMM|nr:hypothetical protein [Mizugakiibacter sediminis]GAP66791.1 hypothetical protein MBSD_n2106 [Mizugakiibacter sediminis]